MHAYTKKQLMAQITGKLSRNFGREADDATPQQVFKACALVLRDLMSAHRLETEDQVRERGERQVHYLSLEILMGRSL
jgi:starch phosphorylase